jgi:hypothetical protein
MSEQGPQYGDVPSSTEINGDGIIQLTAPETDDFHDAVMLHEAGGDFRNTEGTNNCHRDRGHCGKITEKRVQESSDVIKR